MNGAAFRGLIALFFVSGVPALVYQLAWQRALFRIFGVNIESVTIVVTAFMLGLGLGSLAGGALSRRRHLPLLPLFAAIELATAAFGLVSLRLFEVVGDAVLHLPLAGMALVTLSLVLVPTLLMGATLPLMVAHLVRQWGNVGRSVGVLYYANTLGAACACFIAALLLFPHLGLSRSVGVAALLNCAVALAALWLHWRSRAGAAAQAEEIVPQQARTALVGFPLAALLVFLSGLISLAYEIFVFRIVSYVSASSAVAFAATLGVFLLGIASGARSGGRYCQPDGRPMLALAKATLLANLVGLALLPIAVLVSQTAPLLMAALLGMTFLLARFWGLPLPLIAHLGVAPDRHAGSRLSFLYLANIVGAALGSTVTGFLLMDWLGLAQVNLVLVLSGLAFALLLLVLAPAERRRKRSFAAAMAGLAAGGVFLLPAATSDMHARLMGAGAPAGWRLVDVIETRSGIIGVDNADAVYGHGIYDGHLRHDLGQDVNGIVRPLLLSMYHPAPRDVLMIGLASGAWAQTIANNPEVRSLTVVEINPGYVDLIRRHPQVASVLANSKVTLVIDDGRRWLRRNPDARFDAVISNTTFHFRSNATNLLSAEFLDLVRRHLKPGGTLFYNSTNSERAQRTACLSFPHGLRLYNHMLVSDQPIELNAARLRSVLLAERIDGQPVMDEGRPGDRAAWERIAALPQQVTATAMPPRDRKAESCGSILARTVGLRPVTDDNMGTEWGALLPR